VVSYCGRSSIYQTYQLPAQTTNTATHELLYNTYKALAANLMDIIVYLAMYVNERSMLYPEMQDR